MGLADLTRITDLFVEGREAVLRDGEDPALLWVNKLNSFEMEESRRDGAAARSRMVLAIKEIGTPDYEQFEAAVGDYTADQLVDSIANAEYSEHFVQAVESIRSDPDWRERLEASERRTPEMSEEEKAVLLRIDEEYSQEVNKRITERINEAKRDLDGLGMEELRDKFRESWIEQRAMGAFSREFQKSQLYYSLRVCKATGRTSTGAWDHSKCESHRQRALDDREEVTQLPNGLLDRLLTVVRAVTVDTRDARFTDALASSSESSAQPSEGAASTPSTPEAMSPVLATTSS